MLFLPYFINTYMTDDKLIDFIKTTSDKLEGVQKDYPYAVIHTHDEMDNGFTDDNLYIGVDRITDNLNIGDIDPNRATRKVGGLDEATFGKLKDKSISQILMDILSPDIVEPVSVSINDVVISYGGNKLIKVGTNLPEEIDIKSIINDGIWSDGAPYAGGHSEIKFSNLGLSDVWNSDDIWYSNEPWNDLTSFETEFGIPSKEGIYKIWGTVEFTEGGIPKDNFNNDYPEKQYGGGTLDSNIIMISSVYPIYINNGDNIKNIKKQPLVDYLSDVVTLEDVSIQNEIDGTLDKFSVYLPGCFSTFEVKQFNTLTNEYDIDIKMKAIEEVKIIDDGEESDISYIRYIRNDDVYDTLGFTKYKIKLKKYAKDI